MSITYIRGEDNTVVDALSRLPPDCFPDEIEDPPVPNTINAILNIATDESILKSIKAGYQADEFCKRVASSSMKGWQKSNDLWYCTISNNSTHPCDCDTLDQFDTLWPVTVTKPKFRHSTIVTRPE